MKQINKQPLKPKLRFPEFQNAPGWNLMHLKNLAKRQTRRNSQLYETRVLTNSAEHGVVDQRNYFNKDIANKGNLDGYLIVERGDYVYNPRISNIAPVGPISRNDIDKGVISPLYTVFRFDSSDNDFYAYYFKSAHWHRYLRYISNSGARYDRMSITNDDFMRMPLPLSTPAEQQKIADCLTSVDDLIAAHEQKLAALRNHKKGLMQQLFPREGESIPRLRFPEFQEDGEWEVATVGNKCISFSGGTPDTSKKEYYGGTISFIRSAEIRSATTELYLTEEGLENSATKLVNRGDVLVALYGANSGDVAEARVSGAINQAILCLRPEASNAFLYHFLAHKKHWILTTYLQGGQGNLSGEIIKSVALRFPLPQEQRKVANCLSTLDDQITAQTQKIAALQQHKQGLMQQLFPSPRGD